MSLADLQWCPTSVQVTVLQARGLRVKGKGGTNDAYALMQVGKEKYQTSVVEKSVAPAWREEAAFDLPLLLHQDAGGAGGGGGERGTLRVHVLHRALVGPDKLLGQAVINLLQLSEDKTRSKTEWFKLLDKTGKADKDRGEVFLDIQFMRNNMTASMFDLSAAGKSRSRLGKFKDKVRGKKKESDAVSGVLRSFTQVLTDSEGEANGDEEVAAGKDDKKKKHKMKSLFSSKSNLQRNMSQSMSILPAKNSSLSGSQSSGLNMDSSEGKKKFKFKIHKRSGSSDGKDSSSSHQKGAAGEQSNLCINGSHVYCEEPQNHTSRIGSNISLASSGHGSMEDVPESSPPSVESLQAVRQYSAWREEEEEEETAEVENLTEDTEEHRKDEEEMTRMEEERRRKEDEDEGLRKQEEALERLAEQKRREEEEERKRIEEEKVRQEENENLRRQEEALERLAEQKRREEEEERKRIEEERVRREEEERLRRQEEEEQVRREEQKSERLAEEKRRKEEEERKRVEEEEKWQREEEERIRMEKERVQEDRRRQEEEERIRRQEEEHRLAEEKRRMEDERMIEEERRKEEEQMRRREEEEFEAKRRLEEQERKQREEEEMIRKEEERRREEENRAIKEKEEYERLAEESRKLEQKERERVEAEERIKRAQEESMRMEEERKRKEEEAQRVRREDEKRRLEEQEKMIIEEEEKRQREKEERIRKEEVDRARKEREEYEKMVEETKKLEEQERRKKEEEERIKHEEEEKIRIEEERRRREEDEERAKKEEMERLAEEKRRLEEQEMRRIEEEEGKRQREEEERIRRVEEAGREKREEEARKLAMEKLTVAEEKKKKDNKTKDGHKAPGKKSKVAEESPAGDTSTNPFDETCSNNPFEDVPDSPVAPDSSPSKVSKVKRGYPAAVSSVESETRSADQKDLIGAQRDKRLAPQPPRGNVSESQREQDVSKPHQAQMNKQSNDKDVKTASVLPQRSVQVITPLSQSHTDMKKSKSLMQTSAAKGIGVAKHSKRPAPSRPSVNEELSSKPQSPSFSLRGGSETKQASVVYGSNPFEDDEDEPTAQDGTPPPSNSVPWPPSASQDAASQAKLKSSKMARAPPPPAQTVPTSSTLAQENTDRGRVTDAAAAGVAAPDKGAKQTRAPQPEVMTPASIQDTSLKEPQPARAHSTAEVTGVKKEAPPTTSRRLQPVKPLNPPEQKSAPVVQSEKNNSTEILSEVQDKTKILSQVNDSGSKGPYSQLTQEELISLVLKQEKQLSERDKTISELELYIDNLLVRVIEENPSILMSLSSLKKTV